MWNGCAQRDGVGDSSGDKDRARNANISLRKVTKTRISFPNEGAVLKLLYLALRNIPCQSTTGRPPSIALRSFTKTVCRATEEKRAMETVGK